MCLPLAAAVPLISAGASLLGGGLNFFGNRAKANSLSDTQEEAQQAFNHYTNQYNKTNEENDS